jgi:hypothetical protein
MMSIKKQFYFSLGLTSMSNALLSGMLCSLRSHWRNSNFVVLKLKGCNVIVAKVALKLFLPVNFNY